MTERKSKNYSDRWAQIGRSVLTIEGEAVLALRNQLDASFARACEALLACSGRVVVSGMGKSGHIGRKIAATLASTGTPAFFVHPGEASHGDLGMVTAQDVFIALSNSGETDELRQIVPLVKRRGATLIAITGKAQSTLAKLADVTILAPVEREACPLNLAPTASTTAALAIGDALAVAVLDARGFGPDDFAQSHPGGALGRRLLTFVSDIMRTGDAVPTVAESASFSEALMEMTRKRMGMTAVLDDQGAVAGIFTDGDLRRLLESTLDLRALSIKDVMTRSPRTIDPQKMAVEAAALMEKHRISQLLVADDTGALVGALNLHDLMVAKVV